MSLNAVTLSRLHRGTRLAVLGEVVVERVVEAHDAEEQVPQRAFSLVQAGASRHVCPTGPLHQPMPIEDSQYTTSTLLLANTR